MEKSAMTSIDAISTDSNIIMAAHVQTRRYYLNVNTACAAADSDGSIRMQQLRIRKQLLRY